MDHLDDLINSEPNMKIIYIFIGICIFYASVNLKLGAAQNFALVVLILVITSLTKLNKQGQVSFFVDTDAKLDSLLDFSEITGTTVKLYGIDTAGYNFPPKFMYMDANLINLYYDIKNSFAMYNLEAYIRSLRAANDLLGIKHDFELEIEASPIVPNLLDNFSSTFRLKHSGVKNGALVNAHQMFLIATERYKLALNHIQSFILVIPSEPIMHLKHADILKRSHILLKRNLDFIYEEFNKKRRSSDSVVSNYDLAQPYTDTDTLVEKNFKFF